MPMYANPYANSNPIDPTRFTFGALNSDNNAYAGVNGQVQGSSTGNATASGLIQPPDWLNNPQDAVIRAMRMAGYNPGGFNPFTRAILSHANDLTSTLLRQSMGPQFNGGLADITNNPGMLNNMAELIRQGGQGAAVLGGGTAADLQRLSSFYQQANAGNGTMNPAVNALAQYVSDPAQALQVAGSWLYGGASPTMRRAAQQPFVNLADYYQQLLETQPMDQRSVLDVLLGQYGGAGRTPFWFNPTDWQMR